MTADSSFEVSDLRTRKLPSLTPALSTKDPWLEKPHDTQRGILRINVLCARLKASSEAFSHTATIVANFDAGVCPSTTAAPTRCGGKTRGAERACAADVSPCASDASPCATPASPSVIDIKNPHIVEVRAVRLIASPMAISPVSLRPSSRTPRRTCPHLRVSARDSAALALVIRTLGLPVPASCLTASARASAMFPPVSFRDNILVSGNDFTLVSMVVRRKCLNPGYFARDAT
ncbi:hypothetical protein DFH09DRAFT_1343417 [Mycena vulgaris]|nr:hypothetical protein DFH09DRAFT_1343417 [Mycena vulgaris]